MAVAQLSPWLLAGTLVAGSAMAGITREARPQPSEAAALEGCQTTPSSAARRRCEERAARYPDRRAQTSTSSAGGWRLVRTPNPRGGKDAVSIMRTADLLRSDVDFAGLMLRCGESGIEILVILIQPFPPRARPQVTVTAGSTTVRFTATVAPPGTALLLPPDAEALATGPWQDAKEVSLAVENEGSVTSGVVPLDGLRAALQSLRASCPSP